MGDPVTNQPVFSRDCAEFEIDIPGTRHLWVLVNHFKSRGYGSKLANDAKRKRQAATVAAILKRSDLRQQWVVVAGDFNELPQSDSLAPLLELPGLRNAFDLLPAGADRWTHRDDATPKQNDQIDYLLVSAALWPHVTQAGIASNFASADELLDRRVGVVLHSIVLMKRRHVPGNIR